MVSVVDPASQLSVSSWGRCPRGHRLWLIHAGDGYLVRCGPWSANRAFLLAARCQERLKPVGEFADAVREVQRRHTPPEV